MVQIKINELLTKCELKIIYQYLPEIDVTKELTEDLLADFEEQVDDIYIQLGFTNETLNKIGKQLETIVDKLAES
ncbi:hypothetical protein [Lentilactobacillus parakefiri]|uniref:Uncharacterized protein n=2 Tax=Lentilactobacillus parakefiri TaxID=152332 RepID=A0A224VFN7_9LACO|nr:hypothetical protein [Lentilactobacillus parakefiri]PAL01030.1 hypothetical protein B8W96_03760 [Lentilactobacillus parakefiri]TDG93434.1 hypothetical protein C5L28_000345 [Lentilactobacillus parakefiri]GAW71060.1 hypothetical protein LPKJCM_00131 [Lentilactobacillus parakefiri]